MEALPLIPGYSFKNPCINDHKLNQKLDYKDGCRWVRDSLTGLGKRPIDAASSAYSQGRCDDIIEYDPSLTYGRTKAPALRQVIPNYVLFAQKCLNLKAFFRQSVFNSPDEHFRIRHVNIIYFLEDDTMCVIEPPVENAGFAQGKIVRRGKIPKDSNGRFYHWKDLNVGIDIAIYGIVYHTVDCDAFTSEFLRSQGIDPGDHEEPPPDSYTQDRLAKLSASKAPPNLKKSRAPQGDPRRRFLEFDGMVLTFDATWNEDVYQVMYFLTDDTIAVKEMLKANSGKDPNRMLLKRTKIPKNWTDLPVWYPSIYLERSDEEVVEYYCPMDLKVGETIFIFGRRFFLFDCDSFTRRYYKNMMGINQPPRMATNLPDDKSSTYQPKACRSLFKKPQTEDVLRKIYHHQKKLRYSMSMIAIHPEDQGREFILEYSLSNGTIKINELPRKNAGRQAGCFLAAIHVPKTRIKLEDCDDEVPIYYSPTDFFIGAKINVFNHRFVITGADLFVWNYIQANADKFPEDVVQNIRQYFKKNSQEDRPSEQVKEDKIEDQEVLLPATRDDESPVDAQKIIASLPEPEKDVCEFHETNEHMTPKQITWADQVQLPCTLTNM